VGVLSAPPIIPTAGEFECSAIATRNGKTKLAIAKKEPKIVVIIENFFIKSLSL
jgi:hypothetical protein